MISTTVTDQFEENHMFPPEENSQQSTNQSSNYYQTTMPTNHPAIQTQTVTENSEPYEARLFSDGDPVLLGLRSPSRSGRDSQSPYDSNSRQYNMNSTISDGGQYNCNRTGPHPLNFITMTPTNYPQVFPLPTAATMTPTNHPQVFPHQPVSTILPMNYPQVFPFQNLTNPHSYSSQLEQQALRPGESVHHPQSSQYFDGSSS
ncbi:unnamed protein product [Aspergillus oryzae]|nr:unnamed protein product [Aspergillus oryzae]